MNKQDYVIGLDYGTDSVRAVLADAGDGTIITTSVFNYPRWRDQLYCDAAESRYRQHPLDYVEGLEHAIRDCLAQAGTGAAQKVRAISVDTTGSTPVAVNAEGKPLALLPEFAGNPDAMFVLWKDHTAVKEAAQINAHAKKFDTDYLQFVGGIYSSEWFWAKLLHILRADEAVRKATVSWVEHCDWIPFLLSGGRDLKQLKRGVCSAGHKGLWAAAFGGYPPNDFFASLDPLLDGFAPAMPVTTYAADEAAGTLSAEWAARLGLGTDVVIGIGAFDAHMGAVGGQIVPYYLSKVMGTSTCDMLVAPPEEVKDKLVRGICGQVHSSVIPGMIGMEAGQSAFGDAYAWFKKIVSWPLQQAMAQSRDENIRATLQKAMDNVIPALTKAAAALPLDVNAELALDWINGRRTPDANQLLKGSITGMNMASDAPRLFRAVVEATCFGARAIVDRFVNQGIPVKGLIGLGGVAKKSPYIMQMMADVMNMPIRIHRTEQTCAIGAAMFAATAAGIYPNVEAAMQAMGQGFEAEYLPDAGRAAIYAQRYERYKELGAFTEAHTH